MACHILHLAVPAAVEPVEKARFLLGELGARDRNRVEAELAAPLPDAFLDADARLRFHAPMLEDLTLHLPDEAATLALGGAFAQALRPGLSVHLKVDLG